MYSVSSRFLDAVTRSGKRKSVVDLYYGGQLLYSDLPVSSGQINLDRNADTRASGNLTIASDEFDFSIIEPYGTEMRVRTGVVFDDGDEELVPMGIFRIEDDAFSEGQKNIPSINFYDRAKALIDTEIVDIQDYSGRTSQNVISTLVDYSLPGLNVNFAAGTANPTLPGGSVFSGQTNWDVVKQCAQGMLGEAYFDRNGQCQIGLVPAITTSTVIQDAVWTIGVGEDGVLIEASRTITRASTYNGIGMYGAADEDNNRPFALVFDEAPLSKTNYFGPFGRKTLKIENPILTTNLQCYNAGREELKNYVGLGRHVSFRCLGNVALDPGDIVLFKFFNNEQELHLIDQLSIPLGSGDMSGSTRTIQFVV